MKFVGRQAELRMLDRFYKSRQAGLMILYGRRRIGKTELLTTWLKRQKINALYWTSPELENAARQLRSFTHALMAADPSVSHPMPEDYSFASWDVAFEHLAKLAERGPGPFVCVIDEFTNLIGAFPPIASYLQRVWDHQLSKIPKLRLILTGSIIGLMEQRVLSARAPLYGRATMIHRLRPLPFGHLRDLFPRWQADERVAAYAVCGGIPAYLKLFDAAGTFKDGLAACLEQGSITIADARMLVYERLGTSPFTHVSILAAIGSGYHAVSEIARMAGVKPENLTPYLQQLTALNLIERRDPVLADPSARKGRYHISDPFLRFYFRFVAPNMPLIEKDEVESVIRKINPHLREFIGGYTFEELAWDWGWSEGVTGGLGFVPDQVGGYWLKYRPGIAQPVQLDVVAVNKDQKRLFIGEAKWGRDQVGRGILTDLVERSQRMPEVTKEGWRVQYGLFSRLGFTPEAVEEARKTGARLVSLSQLESVLVAAAARIAAPPNIEIEF
jgi:hypothetical protein